MHRMQKEVWNFICLVLIQLFPPYILILTHWRKNVKENIVEKKVKLLKVSNFIFFYNVFYAICILKFFNSQISFVVCSSFEFGTSQNDL